MPYAWRGPTRARLPVTPERVAKLRQFGLSEYASRTYLALLDLGTAEARDVSGISKVPASKVYRILEQLHEKGLVVILPEFPRKYAPVPFAEFLDKIHEEHRRLADAIARDRPSLAAMFAVQGDVGGSDRGSFTALRGRRNVLEKMAEVCASAREDVVLVASPGCLRRPELLTDLARGGAARGARIRVVLPAGTSPGEIPPELSDVAETRLAPSGVAAAVEGGALLVADRDRALLVRFVPDDGHAYEGNDAAVAADEAAIAGTLRALLESTWDRALPLRPHGVPIRLGDETFEAPAAPVERQP